MRIVFFGTPGFAVPTLEALVESSHEVVAVVAQPDRPAGRGLRLRPPETVEIARGRGLEVRQPAQIRDEALLAWVRELRADAGVVVAYGRILPDSLLRIPRHGFLNVHGSLLPRYRGAAPIQRAIEQGETMTGVTIIRLDEELDHGPIFDAAETAIAPDARTPELFDRLGQIGGHLLVSVLDRLERGSITPREQDHARATRAPRIEKSEGLVTWREDAKRLYDRFRAFWPWPGVFVSAGDETIRLVEILPAEGEGVPGTILAMGRTDVVVANGRGATRLVRVQRPGGKPIAAADLARARDLGPGARFP